MIRRVTGVKASKTTTVMAPWGSASKGSKAHIAAAGGDSRRPTVLFNLLVIFLPENVLPVHNLHLTHGKGGHAVQLDKAFDAITHKEALHPLLYRLMYS